jgi:type III secretion protein U
MFTRDNRMTLTERKREMKESYGDPHVQSERRAERKRLAETAGLTGPNAANLWITGPTGAVGITYKPERSGVPIVAVKADAATAREFLAAAAANGKAIMENPDLFAALAKEGKAGQPIPRSTFTPVAQALVKAGFTG